ncbi:MAG TPA: HDIG domain-containing metalloprotein [Chthoniobacterales bacterium]|jgi:putative nucleotidyltransferase with HDIG domain
MWKIFQRRRLISQGLSSRKTRRKQVENPIFEALECQWPAKIAIMVLFNIGLGILIFSGEQTEPVKHFIICLLVFGTAMTSLWINYPKSFASNTRLLLILSVCFLQLVGVRLILANAVNPDFAPLLFPYAFAPLMLSVLIGRHHGLYAALFCSLWGMFLLPTIKPVFIVLSLITGFIAVFVTLQVRRRSRLIRAGLYVGIATWVIAATFGLISPIQLEGTDWRMIGWQSLFAVGMGLATAIVVSGILPAFETTFNITTDISWLEMADMNHPLLRRLSMEAPGTYHHSLAVANLAEAAAEAVDANPTICRVCAYFHDIGKLVKPEYFSENMPPGHNPHDELTPTMSALIIIAHVKEGVDLALKNKLNPLLVDVINQHHGTSLVGYFYQRALQQQQDARLGGKIMNLRDDDIPEVHEESFRYPGPKPQTKESAIVSLADTIESASRSIERPTAQRIEDLVNDLIDTRIADHQLDESPLTLDEIRRIAESFRSTLSSMMHSRVAYPAAARRDPKKETRSLKDAPAKRSEQSAA